MAAGQNHPGGQPKPSNLTPVLVPVIGVALLVVLVVVVASVGSGSSRKMSDGSDGSADDSGLKEIAAGVKYRDVKEGEGDPCPPGAKVTIKYAGWLTDGTEFDASTKPVPFELNKLIPGWREGIPNMKKGGIRKLVIAPEKGYGARAAGKIPANSTLIFEVSLIDFTPSPSPPRPRRTPPPTDLTKLSDGTAPNAADPGLKPIGSEGLTYRDVKVGDGPEVPRGGKALVDYIGWRQSDGGMFDSSWKPERGPFSADLSGGVIEGWMEGVPGMKVGGIRKLVIPPGMAYRDQAKPGIPANSTLVFEIEVLGIE